MFTNLRSVTKMMGAVSAAMIMTTGVALAEYPDRPVSWIVPFPPGGPTDVASRVLANAFEKELGQTFVVVNRSGASGSIGMRQVATAKPDGYTIGTLAGPSLLAPLMQESMPYDLTSDVEATALAYLTPLILVSNPEALPDVTDLESLARHGKNNDMSFTSPANGSIGHLTLELLSSELGFQGTHIGYQGSAPAVTAVLSGEVPLMLADSVAVLQHIKAGRLRALAVTIDGYDELPDVPSLSNLGVQSAKTASWGGIVTPARTPADVVSRLSATMEKVLQDPEVMRRLVAVGAYPQYEDAETLAARIAEDTAVWKQVISDNGLRALR